MRPLITVFGVMRAFQLSVEQTTQLAMCVDVAKTINCEQQIIKIDLQQRPSFNVFVKHNRVSIEYKLCLLNKNKNSLIEAVTNIDQQDNEENAES